MLATQEVQVMPVTPMKHFSIFKASVRSPRRLLGGLWDPVLLPLAIEPRVGEPLLGSDDFASGFWVKGS